MSIEVYKAVKPSAFDTLGTLNNNCFTLRIKARLVEGTEDEKVFDKKNIISGRYVSIKMPESRRSGTARDLTEEYKRLKYSDKQQAENEKKMDETAFTLRDKIVSGEMTKRDAIDHCWLEKRYDHRLIMYITMSYYSTVYERRVVLENEKKL